MRKITLRNITPDEVKTLQDLVFEYQAERERTLRSATDLLDAVICIDISLQLWVNFRNRIEKDTPKKGYTISLKPSEAAVLLKCCIDQPISGDYAINVSRKFTSLLDQQIKSLT